MHQPENSATNSQPSGAEPDAHARSAGGLKKVLYTVAKIRQMGVGPAAKALRSNNTCKACGLGMGGQKGGMTNELDEFPSVCNKSVQAQSTDAQPAIPLEAFQHSIAELQELDERELAHLGRLDTPLWKAPGDTHFTAIDWETALGRATRAFDRVEPERSFFYSSGRSSNEAGFLLQLLGRMYGTNNINNCSYYCHQATGEGLGNSIGTGTATVELEDLKHSDLIFIIGANPASNHPRLLHLLQQVRERGGQVIVINPARERGLVRFAVPKSPRSLLKGGTWIASAYLQPRIGSDVLVLQGIAKSILERNAAHDDFLRDHTNGADDYVQSIRALSWSDIEKGTALTRQHIENAGALYANAKGAVFAWGMGVTHHLNGVANVEEIANLALLRGMVGKPGAGLLPLRGHSNVQGIGTIGVKPVLTEDVLTKLQTTLNVTLPKTPGLDTMAAMQTAAAGNIDAALLLGGNLFGSNPDSAWAKRALDAIGFKLFLTTTLNRGHVHGIESGSTLILPVAARDEETQPTTQESMFNYVRLSNGGINRLENVKPESWILAELAERLLPDSPVNFTEFKSHSELRRAIAATVPGMEALASIDVARKEFHIARRVLHEPVFNTGDNKANFCLNSWAPAPRDSGYAFTLSTIRSEGQFNTIVYENEDSYRNARHRWCVLMCEEDIREMGLSIGDRVTLRSAQGEMIGVEVVAHNLPRGDVMAYFPEANVLTSTSVDARSKTPAFKSTPVAIEKLLN